MKKLNTRRNFINILVDCQGHSEEEAKEYAHEYNNNVEDWITDRGGRQDQIQEAKEFCGII